MRPYVWVGYIGFVWFDLVFKFYCLKHKMAGDPDAILKVHGREEVNDLKDIANDENLQVLNLT